MKLNIIGTGNASVTKYYNTCFTISDGEQHFLVDTGGGNGILRILEEMNISLASIHDMFISHSHSDHMLGSIWIIRIIGQMIQKERYEGIFHIYCHKEVYDKLHAICEMLLMERITSLFGKKILFHIVEDGEQRTILGKQIQFFDIQSEKEKQFGFVYWYEKSKRLLFCGDEPLYDKTIDSIEKGCVCSLENCDWILHEAFCMYREQKLFKPYEKFHSTVKEACELGEHLKAKNLLLYHTEDTHTFEKTKLYYEEGKQYYSGNLLVPLDGESYSL